MKRQSRDERGAALLSVLLLVAVMAVIAATALDRLTLATRIAGSAATVDQGRAYAFAAEQIALRRVADLVGRDPAKLTPFESGPKASVKPSADPVQRARESLVHVLLNHNDFVTIR